MSNAYVEAAKVLFTSKCKDSYKSGYPEMLSSNEWYNIHNHWEDHEGFADTPKDTIIYFLLIMAAIIGEI